MAAALTTKAAATATTAAVVGTRDTAATTTAGRRVTRYRNVVQRENTGVENPAAHGAGCPVAAIAAVARDQTPGNHQTIEGHGVAGGDFYHSGLVLAIEGDVRDAVVVQVAIDGDVLVDQQLRGELYRHAGAEGHDVAVLRRRQRCAQRADPGVRVVGGGPRGEAPLILAHRQGRQHVGALDLARGDFQIPVAAHAGAVVRGGYIAAGQLCQRVNEAQASVALGGVAAVNEDVAANVHVLADVRQQRTALSDVVGR